MSEETKDQLFNAGPRLGDEPAGDTAAQAVASLRGYSYQLFASAFAWVNLHADEVLHLEVAQDYAVVGAQALNAVEVKDRPNSTLTLNSEGVRAAIESFVKLVEINPQLKVRLHFLSTGQIGLEKTKSHRIEDGPALKYWRRAAAGADVAPLRKVLMTLELTPTARAFIDARDDEHLREQFLRRIHWDCGAPKLDQLAEALEASLERFVIERLDARDYEKGRLASAVMYRVLMTCVRDKDRRLDTTTLKAVLIEANKVSVPRWQLDVLVNAFSTQTSIGESGRAIAVERDSSAWERDDSIPVPALLAPRSALVREFVPVVARSGVGFLSGSSGSGKTLVARLTARALGGQWGVIDCRDLSAEAAVARLRRALSVIGTSALRGVILDDLNVMEEAKVRRALSVLVSAARRADVLCIVTAYLGPSSRLVTELGSNPATHFEIGSFTEQEIGELVAAAGGDPHAWTRAVFRESAFGHPQLAQAIILGLRMRGWPIEERDGLLGFQASEDVEAERRAVRRHLMEAIPEPARVLLYRTSLIIGRFGRDLAMALGGLAPPVVNPGEKLDLLVGPWIEPVGRAQLRMSPLVQSAGREVIGPDEQPGIHRAIAEHLVRGRKINVADAGSAFFHALMGRAERVLLGLAHSVLVVRFEQRRQLAEWMIGLRLHRLDKPIDAPTKALPVMLRLAQFLLVSTGKDGDAIRACWAALHAEVSQMSPAEHREGFEFMMLAKVLIDEGAAAQLPGWIDLILRFEALARNSPGRAWILTRQAPNKLGREVSAVGVIFLAQLWHVGSVAGLLAAFERLNQLELTQRSTLCADLLANPGDFRYVVDNAWLAEHKRGNVEWRHCAEAYSRMATLAFDWGYRVLALHCQIACAIVLDEYGKDSVAAEQVLEDATALFGEDVALSRARARLFYRRKDYQSALQLMRAVKNQQVIAKSDPIEQAYLFREAGVSAGELDGWAEAREWFAAAREAASRAKSPAMKVMSIGLHADEALAAARAGDLAYAVETMHVVVGELGAVDPSSSRVAGYCHRVVRHGILWLFGLCTRQAVDVEGQPSRMVAGMCSNPEPPDLSDLPLASIDHARYLLAQSAVEAAIPQAEADEIVASLAGHTIPLVEMALRHLQLGRAIAARNVAEVLRLIPAWVDVRVYMESHPEAGRDFNMIEPRYVEIPKATAIEKASDRAAQLVSDVAVAFGAMCAMSADADAMLRLRKGVRNLTENEEVLRKLDVMAGEATEQGSDLQLIFYASRNAELTPNELLVASMRLLRIAARSVFKATLGRSMGAWSRAKWSHAISQQTFLMSSPRLNVPAIQAALDAAGDDLGFVGRLLLAAEPAVATRLDQGHRDFLAAL
jgi:hypothetical protein